MLEEAHSAELAKGGTGRPASAGPCEDRGARDGRRRSRDLAEGLQVVPATGGLVVEMSGDSVRIENPETPTTEDVPVDEIVDVEIVRP